MTDAGSQEQPAEANPGNMEAPAEAENTEAQNEQPAEQQNDGQ